MNPGTPLPSWDLFISLFFIVGLAYGFIMQKERVFITLVSCYVGLVIAQTFSQPIIAFFAGDKVLFNQFWIKSSASPLTVKTTLFLGVIFLVNTRSGLVSRTGRSSLSPIELLGYSFFNIALILSSLISFMPVDEQTALAQTSKFARLLIHYHHWWLVLPTLLLLVTGYRKKSYSDEY